DHAACEERLQQLLDRERHAGFDLDQAPLLRADVARTHAGHLLVLTFHHAILDGWSLAILLGELAALYTASADERAIDLGTRRPFRDYIAWLLARDTRGAEEFWRDQLRGFTSPTPLVDALAARQTQANGVTPAEAIVELSEAATATVRDAARRSGVT